MLTEHAYTSVRLRWSRAHRIISTRAPTIDLFEDLAPAADWDALIAVESLTNPRLAAALGQLELIPPARRVRGPGASYLMAPLTHISPDRAGRFHDGHFGAIYCAQTRMTAIREVAFHRARFHGAAGDPIGTRGQWRELWIAVDHRFDDLRALERDDPVLSATDYAAAQALARQRRAEGSDGLVYRSVRDPGGQCLAAFWPDVLGLPVHGAALSYHYDGAQIDLVRVNASDDGDGQLIRLG